jgi:hypothetical protein
MINYKPDVSRITRLLAIQLVFLSYLTFSYNLFGNWWHSSLGTVLILLFSYFAWGNDNLKITGLKLKTNTIIISIVSAILLTLASLLLMKVIGENKDISIQFTHWKSYYHIIFYVLNEEIVLGAITLYYLVKVLKIEPLLASVLLAIAFAIFHLVFYRWIFSDRTFLNISTLVTLFLVGLVRNNLIIQTGHIGYSWALHAGWMLAMFGCTHFISLEENYLSESSRFNLYLGSSFMLIISIFLAAISIYILLKKKEVNYKRLQL